MSHLCIWKLKKADKETKQYLHMCVYVCLHRNFSKPVTIIFALSVFFTWSVFFMWPSVTKEIFKDYFNYIWIEK